MANPHGSTPFEKSNFANYFNVIWVVQSSHKKYSA